MESSEFTDHLFKIHEAVTRIETLQKSDHDLLFGNGQPGVLHNFNKRVVDLESYRDKSIGRSSVWAAVATVLSLLGTELLHWFSWKH